MDLVGRGRAGGIGEGLDLSTIPAEDPAIYDMMCRADTVGVFQIESRAQMAMLPRLRPRNFYDLVVEVSIVRPGPIQGGIVHPYLRRRRGEERVVSICPEADRVLEKTLGVPVFQEQAMRLAIEVAGFTPDEADALRKAMGAWRRSGSIDGFRHRMVIYPDQKFAIVVLCNRADAGVVPRIDAITDAYLAPLTSEKRAAPKEQAELESPRNIDAAQARVGQLDAGGFRPHRQRPPGRVQRVRSGLRQRALRQ
jgi:hypothetical protein